ncbi:MAG: GntR family transcriptional regulator [Alphaproteobacteria bacterium]|nr:GntR family transcriptional regulator [Alphaproteobacteria bacterium]
MDTVITAGLLSKSASAYEHIRTLAVRGELRPGRRLSPPDVAQALRISVTPVRDALTRLAAEGFILGSDGRGFFTRPVEVQEQHDLERLLALALLASLNGDFGRGGPGQSGIGALEAGFAEAGDRPQAGARCADAVTGFLVRAVESSGDAILPRLVRLAADRSRAVRVLALEEPAARQAELEELRALAANAGCGDLPGFGATLNRRMARLSEVLPGLVAAANAAASRLRFP